MSSFGYLAFVLSLINSVVNAANNVNANQNNNNNNNNNNNDNNNNVVGGEKTWTMWSMICIIKISTVCTFPNSEVTLKHFKQTSDILLLQIARSRFMGSCSEHISFLECGKFEHQSEQWQHGDSRPSKAEVRTKRKGTSKNTQGSCPPPFVS